MQIIEGMLPPGGWHFKSKDGSYRVPHTGEAPNVKILSDMLQEYRLENQLPVGDPLKDVEEYICSNYPRNCAHGQEEPFANLNMGAKSELTNRFVDIISSWANTFYKNQDRRLIPISEAEQRAQACLKCPLNQMWENDCPSCVTNAQRVLSILRQGKEVHPWRKLHGCRAHGFCARTAVHIERDFLPPASEGIPEYCWMR